MVLRDRHRYCNAVSSMSTLPSTFSSSLLEAICSSIDENEQDFAPRRRNDAEIDIHNLRRAIMVETWMESYGERRLPVLRSSSSISMPPNEAVGDEKKQPVSPCGKIARFLYGIFNPRNAGKNDGMRGWGSIKKSRSMKDTTTTTIARGSCLIKNHSTKTSRKSKRSVKFCTVDEKIHSGGDVWSGIGSRFIKANIDDLQIYDDESKSVEKLSWSESGVDDVSCSSSSDLFELGNIGHFGVGAYGEDSPMYQRMLK
ncbi:protein BIG GRAIN 1-like A [Andrographis paniculata]|uniref:protein BIG GRAIN 1-like A n=1 Tax=Andrographis paniculata TaxID=175694 RepID=UPI0021E91380|nr:protein BIG GRAIN 1-like A [Andrographis paniculata]